MAAACTASEVENCDAAVDAMNGTDPDLDPVWGLLVASAEDPSDSSLVPRGLQAGSCKESTHQARCDDGYPVGGDATAVPSEATGSNESASNASNVDDCDAAIEAMNNADPDLDPVWGLLVAEEITESLMPETRPTVVSAREGNIVTELVDRHVNGEPAYEPCDEFVASQPLLMAAPCADTELEALPKPISAVVDKEEVSAKRFALPETSTPPTTVRWDVKGCDAYVLDGVLNEEECNILIEQGSDLWSFWDSSANPRVKFRNAHTIEVTHQEIADRIWHRIKDLVNPSVTMENSDDERHEVDIEGTWRPYGVNPNMLFGRYLDGGHFAPHTDGTTVVDFNRRTFYSCVLFLNKSPIGGHTRMYQDAQIRKELVEDSEGRLTGDPDLILDTVAPMPGRMLVFYHRLMHEGVPASEKYIIRTDVLYHRTPEVCTAPEDVEAFAMYEKAQLLAEHGDCEGARKLFARCFKLSRALAKVYRM